MKNNKITKYIVSTLMLLSLPFFVVQAVTLVDSGVSLMGVGKISSGQWSGWRNDRISVGAGDTLAFNLHYSVESGDVNGIYTRMDDLDGRSFSANSKERVAAFLKGSGVSNVSDTAEITFLNNTRLEFERFSFQENSCQESTCETDGGNNNDVLTRTGYSIGNKNSGNIGNVVVRFRVASNVVNNDNNNNDDVGNVRTLAQTEVEETSVRLNGRVIEGDLSDVWFAFSERSINENPSCSNTSERRNSTGGNDEGDTFYSDVRGLRLGTGYNFRTCGEDADGNILSGYLDDFFTANGSVNNSDNSDNSDSSGRSRSRNRSGRVDTYSATNIGETTATLEGKVKKRDLDKVWFVISKNDSKLVCSSASLKKRATGGKDVNDNFSAKVVNLTLDTKYYFRACGMDNRDRKISGSVKHFTTEGATNYNVDAITNEVIVKGSNVIFKGEVVNNDEEELSVYFKYGTAKNKLNIKTTKLKINDSITFQSKDKMTKNGVYYVRSVVENEYGRVIEEGNIKSFKITSIPKKIINKPSENNNSDSNDDNGGQAASIFGSGFDFSGGIFWIIFILIVAAINFVIWKVILAKQKVKVEIKKISEEERNKLM